MIDGLHHCPKCAYDLTGEVSGRAHRYMHVLMSIALDNWPSGHPHIRPRNTGHLRAWLFCQDGVDFFSSITLSRTQSGHALDAVDYYAGHMAVLAESGRYGFLFETDGAGLELRFPQTAALTRNGGPRRAVFHSLLNRLIDEIVAQTGMEREKLKAQAKRDLAPRRLGVAV
jgi:hypothetical protein